MTEGVVRIQIGAAGDPNVETVDLSPGEVLLVGRAPDERRLSTELVPAGRQVRMVRLAAAAVSANHALLWLDDDGGVRVRDLGSRNGSWLRVHAGTPVRVERGGQATGLSLQLGRAGEEKAGGGGEEPDDAKWQLPAQFGDAVMAQVQRWLSRGDLPVRVWIGPSRPAARGVFHSIADARIDGGIPLAGGGSSLFVAPRETVDAGWPILMHQIFKYVQRQNAVFEAEEDSRGEGLILASEAIRSAHAQVVEAARRGVRLLLLGPSGSGKEGLARCYHRYAGGSGSFVARNCSSLRPDLLQSELFGAEPGAFTGCVRRIVGAIERAHNGTVFLDEIGDMAETVQPMLLRFLDSGDFERMGAYGQPRAANVRIVCATNKDLRAAVLGGRFRADLWYRLSMEVVEVPPLAERLEDLEAFLASRRLAGGVTVLAALAPEAVAVLRAHRWEGNFRELSNFAARFPPSAEPGSIDAKACRALLERGALSPIPTLREGGAAALGNGIVASEFPALTEQALAAFREDNNDGTPDSWNDVKNYIENYLKPLLFMHLAGAAVAPEKDTVDAQVLAARLDADRGTAKKQIKRFFDRFRRGN